MTSNVSVRAGGLRHRIVIETATVTQNEYGEEEESWSTWKRVWARVSPVSSREYLEARVQGAEVSHRVEIRALDGLNSDMRVKFKGRTLTIVQPPRNIDEVGRRMEMLCREVV